MKVLKTSDELVAEDLDIIEYRTLSPDVNSLQSPHLKEAIQTLLTNIISLSPIIYWYLFQANSYYSGSQLSPVAKKQLKDLVTYEAKQQIPRNLKEALTRQESLLK